MSAGDFINTTVSGITKIQFEWQITQRRAAAIIIPAILEELRHTAPVSQTKPDAGRFKKSIGYRLDSSENTFKVSFVSTAPYAKYVINPTAAGATILPINTMALRWQDGFGNYVFAKSVVRGATLGNDFNKKVADKLRPLMLTAFGKSITITTE